MQTRRFLTMILISLLAAASAAEPGASPSLGDRTLVVDLGVAPINLDGTVTAGTTTLVGTTIDVADVLGMDDWATGPFVRLAWRPWQRHRFIGDYTQAGYDGRRSLAQTFTFGGTTYTLATTVTSNLDVKIGSVDYRYSIYRREESELGLGLGARIFAVKMGIAEPTVGSVNEEIAFPIPVLCLDYRHDFTPRISGEAEISGLGISFDRNRASFFDARALARVRLTDRVWLSGGYRYMSLDARADQAAANVTLHGPLALLTAGF